LEEPLRRIASNAGKDGSVIVQDVKDADKPNWGYDAQTDEFGDMVERGVIDPALVTRAALENAVSIAAMVLTTNCLVSEIEDESIPAQPTGMGGPPMPAGAMGGY
jgi:chaperonin GroEL